MKRLLSGGLIAAALAVPVFAQETTETSEDNAAAQADAAFPVLSAPAEGPQPDAVFGGWELRCVELQSNEKCVLTQFARTGEGEVLARLTMEALPDGAQGAAGITIVGPLGILLPAGVTLQIDDGRLNRYPFAVCERDGCLSRFGITETEVEVMKAGTNMTLGIVPAASNGDAIPLQISLAEFPAAWDALQERSPQ
ncbi:MAG: invasion associated locus B family protein [Pseudomonadota bacterium]